MLDEMAGPQEEEVKNEQYDEMSKNKNFPRRWDG